MKNTNFVAFPFDLVGFDLDGTLVDSNADITAAVNHALSHIHRAPLTVDQVAKLVGGGSRHLLMQALEITGGVKDVDVDDLLAKQLTFYEQHPAVHTQIFDGALNALDQLADLGVPLAIATNKMENIARLLLHELGIIDRFAFIIGGDTLGPGRNKPAPDMLLAMNEACGATRRTAFVGDTIYDVKAAQAADATSVIMDFHGTSQNLGGDHIISHYDQLVPLLSSLHAVSEPSISSKLSAAI